MAENEAGTPSRRKFLKTAATAGVGTVAAAAALNTAFPAVLPEKMVFEKNSAYWSRELSAQNPALTADLDAYAAIIGGGFTGLSAAYYLKRSSPQKRVVLLEAARCGNGASGRNGAMMLTSTADRYLNLGSDPALDKRIYDLTVDNIQRIQMLANTLAFDAEIERNGALQVCNSKTIAEEGRGRIEKLKAAGFPVEFWDKQKVVEAIGTNAYEGALFDPHSGQVHPGRLVALWKRAAESVGVEIFEGTPVVHVEEGEQNTLTTANGKSVKASVLVLATNAFTSKLGYLRRVATPVFDYVAMTAPLSETKLAEIRWKARIPFNDHRTEVFYLGITRDNRLHIGGGPVDYVFNNGVEEPATAAQRYAGLRAELARIYPALSGEPFESTWSGSVDMSLDQTPAVGQMGVHGNVFYGIGFSGHGVNLTSVFGRIIADLVLGNAQQWRWFPYLNRLPLYTPNEPFRWAGVHLALGYYRATDPKTP